MLDLAPTYQRAADPLSKILLSLDDDIQCDTEQKIKNDRCRKQCILPCPHELPLPCAEFPFSGQ